MLYYIQSTPLCKVKVRQLFVLLRIFVQLKQKENPAAFNFCMLTRFYILFTLRMPIVTSLMGNHLASARCKFVTFVTCREVEWCWPGSSLL